MAADSAKQERATRRVNRIGPTGRTIAANIARLRNAAGLTTAELAARMDDSGHAITASAITKTELAQRKVEAEELLAFAVALNVNASALLLPPTTEGSTEVSYVGEVPAADAWAWADGERPLLRADDEDTALAFQLHGRPAGRRGIGPRP